jgi:hypothetical protein
MIGNYMDQYEMAQLKELLSHSLEDTLSCWTATRINGASASMASEGNVCVPLLKAFDEIARQEREACAKVAEACGVYDDYDPHAHCAAAIRARTK